MLWSNSSLPSSPTTSANLKYNLGNLALSKSKAFEGFGNFDLNDNVYESAEGNYTIVKQNGNLLNLSVVNPLIKAFSCEFTQSGKLSVQGEVLDGIVNYGDGTCDNQATYQHSNGLVITIDL